MSSKHSSDSAGLKAYIEARCKTDPNGHTLYSGPTVVELAFRKTKVPRAYWVLTYGPMPEHSFLVQRCSVAGCIDPDHWSPSRSPNEYLSLSEEQDSKPSMLSALQEIQSRLARIESMLAASHEESDCAKE